MTNGTALKPRPEPGEWRWVLLLLGFFLGLNLATYNLYPMVWCDEVWFSEPAVNFVQQGVFHSTAWLFEPPNTFPTVNCPLYLMALVPWLKVLGTSVLAVRSFNYALMAIGAFLVWVIGWRFELVKSRSARLWLVGLLHLGYGMSFAYRCSRPDVLGMVCLLLLVLSFKIQRQRAREACLFGLAATAVWIGFQVAMFAGAAAAAAWLVFRRPRWQEIFLLALGEAFGVVSLLLFYSWNGALSFCLTSIGANLGFRYVPLTHLSLVEKVLQVARQSLGSYVDDFSTTALLLAAALLLAVGWQRMSRLKRSLLIYSMVLAFGIPSLFDAVGHWGFYYSYLRFVPLALAFFAAWSDLGPGGTASARWLKLAGSALVSAAMMVGLPMRLGFTLFCCHLVPRQEIQRTVSSNVRPADVVLSDHAALFEAKHAANLVYDTYYSSDFLFMPLKGSHRLTPQEKRSITVLILRPEKSQSVTNFFGGPWQAATAPFGDTQDLSRLARWPVVGRRLAGYAVQPQTERYQLQIYRRSE